MKNASLVSIIRLLLFALPIVFLSLFFFYPLLSIFQVSLAPEGRLDLSGFVTLVTRPYYRELLWFTTWQAVVSTALTLLVGLPAAYVFARFRFPGKTLLRAILTVPFVMPTVVVGTAFLALLGPRGRLNDLLMTLFSLDAPPLDLQGITLILLAHVFYNLAVVIRIVGGFWANLDPQLEEAAMMLGARPQRLFREITLPLLLPAIGAAALLVFLFTFSSFGVILILGGLRYATIEVEVYRQMLDFFNPTLAASLSLVQMAFTLLLMAVYSQLQARAAVPLNARSQEAVQRAPRTRGQWLFLLAALGIPLILVVSPLAALVERSLTVGSDGVTLDYYLTLGEAQRRSVFAVSPLVAIRNSLLFAGATMALSLLLGLLSAYSLALNGRGKKQSRWRALLDPFFLLPLGTSAVTLGFGYIVALDEPPLNLRTSALLVPLAHSLIAFPFVVRTLLPTLRSINPALREAAAVMGARPLRLLREIDLPLIARSLLVSAVFAFAVSMGEFGATSLVSRPEWPTLPVVIFRFLGQQGIANYGRALAMSVILMSTCVLAFVLIERFRVDDIGEF